jgi:hypothetical protein
MNKPNLFDFATSELSQDAFIAWLLTWANKEYAETDKNLHACAVDFVRKLLNKDDYVVETVKVKMQWKHTDVIAEVNNEFFILIEDKTGTSERKNQLKQYLELAVEYCKDKNMAVVPTYFKMEEQSNLSKVIATGYSIFTREKMLSILEKYHSGITTTNKNDILLDYCFRLKRIDANIASFNILPFEKWHWYSWMGFYSTIQKELGGNWDYVPNPSGGFLGFWWHWIVKTLDDKEFAVYLQLEQHKFIFKVEVNGHHDQSSKLRDYYRKPLFEVAKEQEIGIENYGKVGAYMGVAKLSGEYRIVTTEGLIDLPATIANLKKMEQLIDAVAAKL